MTDSAKPMTASERAALIAELRESACPGRPCAHHPCDLFRRAAAELSRLAAENERLRKMINAVSDYADVLDSREVTRPGNGRVARQLRAIITPTEGCAIITQGSRR